ncbi:MAG TPA: alpha/beta fold hydrolase [Blastocatellia bacterium]|nr:alpha/beta fold hydrolase [Blastocatellia bacterium]
MSTNNRSEWFLRAPRQARTDLRLFCFPYAGGTGAVYRSWAEYLPSGVEVIAVELPGRGRRMSEDPFRSLPLLVEALIPELVKLLDMKFAFFGHSMGSMIAFETARELRRRGLPQPAHLLVSGRRAPQILKSDPITYDLPDEEFRAELLRLNGTPVEVLEHEELMKLLLPVLRADFELVQTYEYSDDAPLSCPIAAYGGIEDFEVPRESLLAWEQQTKSRFSLRMLPGDHFFLRSASRQLFQLMGHELLATVAAR